MRQNALDRLIAPGPVPRGVQRLPEVLLKGPREAGRPGQSLVGTLLGLQIAQTQAQITALHLLRRRTGGDGMLEILLDPPSQTIGSRGMPRYQGSQFFRAAFWGTLSPSSEPIMPPL